MSLNLDASFYSFQKRLRSGELQPPELNDSNRRLYGLPSQLVQREAFLGDRVIGIDDSTWRQARIDRRVER